MLVERGVKFESEGEAESGASTGARTAPAMPSFTDEALKKGLGPRVNEQIEVAFENVVKAREKAKGAKAHAERLALKPEFGPDGVGLADVD